MNGWEAETLITASAAGFVAEHGGAGQARRGEPGRRAFAKVVELGWLGLLVPEEAGGLAMSGRDFVALVEELGAGLVTEPVVPASAAALLLARLGSPEARGLLAGMLAGRTVCVSALHVTGGIDPATGPAATFHDGERCDLILVHRRGNGGDWAVAVPREAPAVSIDRTVDGGSVGSISLAPPPPGQMLAEGPAVAEAFALAADTVALGTAALLLGAARRALGLSLDHLRTRRQFGAPIGSFQALQHRAATLHVAGASARALLHEAAGCFETPNRAAACAAARARAAETALATVKEAVQFHGATGFTDEHEVGLHMRRVLALAAAYGNAAAWRGRFLAARQQGGQEVERDPAT